MAAVSHQGSTSPVPRRDWATTLLAMAIDTFVVIVFVSIGRQSHNEGSALGQILTTALPFLIGLVVGWLVVAGVGKAWGGSPLDVRTGAVIWVVTLVVGMLTRHFVFDKGTAPSFIMVATIFLGVFLVGWRAIATLIRHHAQRDAAA